MSLFYSIFLARNKRKFILFHSINIKVNAVARLEFELTYYDVAVVHISYYAMETDPMKIMILFFYSRLDRFPC